VSKKLLFFGVSILILVLINLFSVSGAHVFDTKAEKAQSSSPATLAYTVGVNGTLLVLSIMITTTGVGVNVTVPPTYNGINLTRAGTTLGDTGAEGTAEIFYLINPPTGASYNIIVTANATGLADISYVASSYSAAPGYTSALDVTNTSSSAAAANPNLFVTTTANGDVIVDALFDGLTSAPTANNQVLLYSRDTGSEAYATQYALQPSSGTIKMNYTIASSNYQYVIAAFKEVTVTPATVTTQNVTGISVTGVTGNGNITVLGNDGKNVTQRGFVYMIGTSDDPTIDNSSIFDSGSYSTGVFSKDISGLTSNTNYRIRAFVNGTGGYGYGGTANFTTLPIPPSINNATASPAYPINGTTVNISANVTGIDRAIDEVIAQILYPNGTSAANYTMTNTSGSIYWNASYIANFAVAGQYTVTIWANDTYGNINNSAQTNFAPILNLSKSANIVIDGTFTDWNDASVPIIADTVGE
jgi:hypothetical protein